MSAETTAAAEQTAAESHDRHSFWLAPHLALKDLQHEWVLTSTLVLAIGAVIAPLLILLGLKFGVIEYQLSRLINDPAYREITPAKTQEIAPEIIEEWRGLENVSFVTPGVSRGASSATIRLENAPARRFDLLPSQAGDPLLAENGAEVPEVGQVVISFSAAQKMLGARAERAAALGEEVDPNAGAANLQQLRDELVGQTALLEVGRRFEGRRQTAREEVEIVGVLDARGDSLDRIYAPFNFVEAIEEYRSGFRATLEGDADNLPVAYPSYDGVALLGGEPFSRIAVARMRNNTGVADVREAGDVSALFGAAPGSATEREAGAALTLRAAGEVLLNSNMAALRRAAAAARIRPVQAPYVDPIAARFVAEGAEADGGPELLIAGEPDAAVLADIGLAPVLPAAAAPAEGAGAIRVPLAVPASAGLAVGTEGQLLISTGDYEIEASAVIVAEAPTETSLTNLALAAQIRSGFDRRLIYDEVEGVFRLTKDGYRGFRLYATSIYEVANLGSYFAANGVEVVTESAAISTVQEMDRALTQLFWLVAVVGVIGAIAAMASSLVAAVERKRVEIGMMRLFGLTKRAIFAFPIVQAIVVAVLATAFAVTSFLVLSNVINTTFASALPLGERLAYLPTGHLVASFFITAAVAAAAALVAAMRATRIDPADAIRQE